MNEQERKNKKLLLSIVGVAIVMVALVGVTYAFFNYTRTGGSNIVRTGQINFSSTQQTINLTNAFPIRINPQDGVPSNNANVGVATINITGDTAYSEGVEYMVSAVDVSNTVGAKTLPISIDVSVTGNTSNSPSTTLGSADEDYFTHHGSSANTSIYKVLAGETISNNDELLVGYIKRGATGVDGNVVIKAYIDASRVAISDTYNETTPETDQYGTTTNWVDNRTVFTTSEWNSLQSNGVSFKIKVESNEGTWVEEPVTTLPTCPGPQCAYTVEENVIGQQISGQYTVGNYNGYGNYFIGHILNNNGIIQESYACGINANNNNAVFCLRGGVDESSLANKLIYEDNVLKANAALTTCDASSSDDDIDCNESVGIWAKPDGMVNINEGDGYAYISTEGESSVGMS